jgi:hypothetical protein
LRGKIFEKSIQLKAKWLFDIAGEGRRKNAGAKNEGKFHYVIENTYRKIARYDAFHYVIEK